MIVRRTLTWRIVGPYVWRMIGVHVLIATAVVVVYEVTGATWLAVPALPVTILASTIGILIAFRNNSGYDRWWEARTLWGGVVNQSRTFARQVLTFLPATIPNEPLMISPDLEDEDEIADIVRSDRRMPRPTAVVSSRLADSAIGSAEQMASTALMSAAHSDGAVRDREGRAATAHGRSPSSAATGEHEDTERRDSRCAFDAVSAEARELVYVQIAFVNAMRCHLRREDPFPVIAPFLRPGLVEALREEQNVPAAILVWMGTRLRRLFASRRAEDTYCLVALDETLSRLTDLLGGCERIKNTPIPRQYDWLPWVAARVYLLLLPLSLVAELGFVTPFVTAAVAFLFLYLDTIGKNVEAPFENDIHDTPMSALSRTIEINLRQMLGETELPPPLQPVNGFLY